jgi:4-hydroxybenzoate polyprenyltransferase
MTLKLSIIEYAKLSSAHFIFLTALVPVTGAIIMNEKNLFLLTILFIIGLSAHIFGFAFNHYNDVEIDGLIHHHINRPLPSGSITKKQALKFIILVLLIGFILTLYFYGLILLLIYIIGIYLAGLYDIYSKKISGMDFILAGSVTTGVIFGAATVSFDFAKVVYIFCILAFIQALNLNLIAGGIKDADHDYIIKSKHISTRLGVKAENGVLFVPSSFKILAYLFGFIYAFFVLIPVILGIIKLYLILIFVLIIINVLFFIITYKMLNLKHFNRQEIRKYVVLQYIINWLNIPILIMSINPWGGLLILYPIFGLIISNLLLYKTVIRPQVM